MNVDGTWNRAILNDLPIGRVVVVQERRIIVPLDGSELAEQALPLAESLAQTLNATMELVPILEEPVMLDLFPSLAIPDRLAPA